MGCVVRCVSVDVSWMQQSQYCAVLYVSTQILDKWVGWLLVVAFLSRIWLRFIYLG